MKPEMVKEYLLSEDGQNLAEYALLLAFVAVICMFVFADSIRNTIINMFGVVQEMANGGNAQGE